MQRNSFRNTNTQQILFNVTNAEWKNFPIDRPGTYHIRGAVLNHAVIQIRFLHSEGTAKIIFENDCHIASDVTFIFQGNATSRCIIQFNVPLAHTVKMKMQRAFVFFGRENVTRALSDLTDIGNQLSLETNRMTDRNSAQPLGSLVAAFQHQGNRRPPSQAQLEAHFASSEERMPTHQAPHINSTHPLETIPLMENVQGLPNGFSASTAAIYVLLNAIRNRFPDFDNRETNSTTHINQNGVPYRLPLVQNANARAYLLPQQIATLPGNASIPIVSMNVTNNARNHPPYTNNSGRHQDFYSPQVTHYANTFKNSNNENKKAWEEAKSMLPDHVKKDFYLCAITQEMPAMPVFVEQQIYDYESLKRWVEGLGKRGLKKFSDPTTGLETHLSKISAPISDFWSMLKVRIHQEKAKLRKETMRNDHNNHPNDEHENATSFKRRRT
jgi:hypothetical protein